MSLYRIQKTAATFTKMKFCLGSTIWSMPMPSSSLHSTVTKWRSGSQESKSIVNYALLFLWAIKYGPYLSQRRCWQLVPQNCLKLFCHTFKNTPELKAAGIFLIWPVVKEVPYRDILHTRRLKVLLVKAVYSGWGMKWFPGTVVILLLGRWCGWKLESNALNL